MRSPYLAWLLLGLIGACSSGGATSAPDANGDGPGGAGGADAAAGSGGGGAGHDGATAGTDGGVDGGDAAVEAPRPNFEEIVRQGAVVTATAPRPAFGAMAITTDGTRVYAVESRRDVEPGPLGLPWRSRFRVAAYDAASAEAWAFAAPPDDVVSDVAVHPSGDVTIAVLHNAPARMAYDLVRLDRDGKPRATIAMSEPQTLPDGDFGAKDPRPMFRMKSPFADANVGGWVRLLADGEGLHIAFLSYVDRPPTDPLSARLAMGVASLSWKDGGYVERWARVVEGPHGAEPVSWTYDELRQRESAIRPFLARDESTGDVLVGRGWNDTRCKANVAVFAEFVAADCVPGAGAVNGLEAERLPLAVTRFNAAGKRQGTIVLQPDADAGEFVPFALAARDGRLAIAGFVVRELPDGTKRTYPDPKGYVDYDGYIAIYDGVGHTLHHHDYNLGRGDVLAGLRWLPEGIVAAGSAGFDRWQGGQSISRGADPLLAWLSSDGTEAAARVIPLGNGSRHFSLFDVAVTEHAGDRAIVAHGVSDAPLTHSGDNGNTAGRTWGPLRVRIPF